MYIQMKDIIQLFYDCLVNSQNYSPEVPWTARCTIVRGRRPRAKVHRDARGTEGLWFWLFTKHPWNNCFITQPTCNSFDKHVWNLNPLISVVFCLTLGFKKGSTHFRHEHWTACAGFKPICLMLYCVVLSHYAEAGSKPDQTALFDCFIYNSLVEI